jgi:hypothetical protein
VPRRVPEASPSIRATNQIASSPRAPARGCHVALGSERGDQRGVGAGAEVLDHRDDARVALPAGDRVVVEPELPRDRRASLAGDDPARHRELNVRKWSPRRWVRFAICSASVQVGTIRHFGAL